MTIKHIKLIPAVHPVTFLKSLSSMKLIGLSVSALSILGVAAYVNKVAAQKRAHHNERYGTQGLEEILQKNREAAMKKVSEAVNSVSAKDVGYSPWSVVAETTVITITPVEAPDAEAVKESKESKDIPDSEAQ